MLNFHTIKRADAASAGHYYTQDDDYYAREGESKVWIGKGAEALGLRGSVDPEEFKRLLLGQIGGQQLRASTRHDFKSRQATDWTLAPPKSVTLQSLIGGDKLIVFAHDQAVAATLAYMEQYAQARRKEHGKSHVENTGNLVAAAFRHETSRELDPHLHTHVVAMNLTRRADGEWRAIKNDELFRRTEEFNAYYMADLALRLQALGYTLRHEPGGSFELAHISREQVREFSQRSAQIEAELAKRGMTRETADAKTRKAIVMATRKPKERVDPQELRAGWRDRAHELGIDFGARAVERAARHERRAERSRAAALPELDGNGRGEGRQSFSIGRMRQATRDASADRSVRFAIANLTERQAIVGREDLYRDALKHGIGRVSGDDIRAAIDRQVENGRLIAGDPMYLNAQVRDGAALSAEQWAQQISGDGRRSIEDARLHVEAAIAGGRLVAAEPRYTTPKALAAEAAILRMEAEGRGDVQPIMSPAAAASGLSRHRLTEGQRNAAMLLLTTSNQIVGVQGSAGTGKSHMLAPAIEGLKARGYKVRAVAQYATAARALGELGTEANTLQSFLVARDKRIDDKTVLVIDEAGTVPTRQMEKAIRIAKAAGARVVTVGDTQQTYAIEAGKPFAQLQAAGMETAYMTEIQRQRDADLKRAVELTSEGRADASLAYIRNLEAIPDPAARREAIARLYVELPEAERERTLIVSATNASRKDINESIREGIGTAGNGREYDTLSRRDTTQAQRRYAQYYEVGNIVQPERNYQRLGLEQDRLYRVTDTGPGNQLTVEPVEGGRALRFNPALATKLSVYEVEPQELAAGDTVRITRNNARLDIANGERAVVVGADPDSLRLRLHDSGREVAIPARHPVHVDLAYAITVHSSQGVTAERTIFDADTKSRVFDMRLWLVAISRAQSEAHVRTNSSEELPEAVMRQNPKHSALEIRQGQ